MYNTQNTVDHYILIATVNSRYASDIVHNIQTNTSTSVLFLPVSTSSTARYVVVPNSSICPEK